MDTLDSRISLQLTGPFRLQAGSRDCRDLPRKAQALIALLALQPGRRMAREGAVALLWGEPGREQGCPSLRQTLAAIREQSGVGLVRLAGGVLSLPREGVRIDVPQFEALAGSSSREDLVRCAALYRGELLADVAMVAAAFDEWLAVERIRLAAIAAEVLRSLALSLVDAGEHDAAVTVARRLVALDELREDSHHLLISVLGRCGRCSDALRHYGACEQILRPVSGEPELEPALASAGPSQPSGGKSGARWWLRSALVAACLLFTMVSSVAVEPTGGTELQSPIVAVADTIGLPRFPDTPPPRHAMPVW